MTVSKQSFPSLNRGSSLSDEIVASYPFYEGSGGIVHDVSGYDNHATLTNIEPDVDWKSSEHGYCLEFDGTNEYGAAADGPSLDKVYDNDKITVSVWTKNLITPANFDAILSHSTNTGWADGWGLYYESTSSVRLWINAYNTNYASSSLTPTDLNHIAGVYDGVNITVYINGVAGTPTAYSGAILPASGPLEIARLRHDSYNIYGQVMYASVWARALSSDEIREQYADPYDLYSVPGSINGFYSTASGSVATNGFFAML